MRQIVLDTETTGLDADEGHRIIEIGCVELENRRLTGRNLHFYLNPERDIEDGALEVHGITLEFLADKPRFADISDELLEYLRGAELIIHNAPFDTAFLNRELALCGAQPSRIDECCAITDTLALARHLHPGQKNDLNALCKRYEIDNSQRTLHGALLDAQILAEVFLAMTGGQTALLFEAAEALWQSREQPRRERDPHREPLPVLEASAEEQALHAAWLDLLEAEAGRCIWREIEHDVPQPAAGEHDPNAHVNGKTL